MTQTWQNEKVMAVTRVQAGPCTVVQVKTENKDGYNAVQVGYGQKKEKNINKPQIGHQKGIGNSRVLKEFRLQDKTNIKKGDLIDVDTFEPGDKIKVSGISKGKGFQGVVKRYGFSGSKKTHGNKDQLRMPGSVGATGPAHIFKGTRMGGRMGNDKVSINNLEIIDIDKENNILTIKGALPGARNGLIFIFAEGELKIKAGVSISADKENAETDSKSKEIEKIKTGFKKTSKQNNLKIFWLSYDYFV
jgi:large subunit ribosomal protein L3